MRLDSSFRAEGFVEEMEEGAGWSAQDLLLEAWHRRNENLTGHRAFNNIPASDSARYFRPISKDDQVAQFCFFLTCFAACTSAGEALHPTCTHRHALGFKTGLMRHLPSTAQWDPKLSVRARNSEPKVDLRRRPLSQEPSSFSKALSAWLLQCTQEGNLVYYSAANQPGSQAQLRILSAASSAA